MGEGPGLVEAHSMISTELKAMFEREGLSPKERAALALALAVLDVEVKINRDIYRLTPSKIELIDGGLALTWN
jgi:hypothetical protein